MSRILVLDTGPAGKIAHPRVDVQLARWVTQCLDAGDIVVLPEIVDYELRRNFLLEVSRGRTSFQKSIQRLDQLRSTLKFLPLDSQIMLKAAELWAEARRQGRPTADPKELDSDVILAAQALHIQGTVVTENVGHLALFVAASSWQEI